MRTSWVLMSNLAIYVPLLYQNMTLNKCPPFCEPLLLLINFSTIRHCQKHRRHPSIVIIIFAPQSERHHKLPSLPRIRTNNLARLGTSTTPISQHQPNHHFPFRLHFLPVASRHATQSPFDNVFALDMQGTFAVPFNRRLTLVSWYDTPDCACLRDMGCIA